MADEIAQVVEMEYKGMYYLFKGTKEAVALMARMVKALIDKGVTSYKNMEGNRSWKLIQENSQGVPPILEFPKEMFEQKTVMIDGKEVTTSEFEMYCKKNKLQYCIMPDFNPEDDYIPVAVLAQDMGVHQEQIKQAMSRRIQSEEAKDKEYDEKIIAAREKIANATTDEERVAAEEELKMLLEGKAQNEALLKESEEKQKNENVIDFCDYLRQGEGTIAEHDPSLAMSQEAVCGLVREYTPYECMWPVREAELVPESREIIYSQRDSDDQIHSISRKFREDEQGVIYSEYYVRVPNSSEVKVFSDYGLSREEWEKQIPLVLKEGGLVNGEPTAVVQSEERFLAYQRFVEENFKEPRAEEKTKEYSSEEAKEFVESHNRDAEQRQDYKDSFVTTVTVPVSKVLPDGEEIICLELAEGLVQGVSIESMTESTATISLKTDASYAVAKPDGEKIEMSGADIVGKLGGATSEDVSKVASRARK